MTKMFVIAILLCSHSKCYQDRLYSKRTYLTLAQCQEQPVNLAVHSDDVEITVRCMTVEDWDRLPKYEERR